MGGVVINNIEHRLELNMINFFKNLISVFIAANSLDRYINDKNIVINSKNNEYDSNNNYSYYSRNNEVGNEHSYYKDNINLKDLLKDKTPIINECFIKLNQIVSKDRFLNSMLNENEIENKNLKNNYRNKLIFVKRGINYFK